MTLETHIEELIDSYESEGRYLISTKVIKSSIESYNRSSSDLRFPKYSFLISKNGKNKTAVKFIAILKGYAHYHRDNGDWTCKAKFDSEGILMSSSPNDEVPQYLNLMIECTEEDWRLDNEGSYPKDDNLRSEEDIEDEIMNSEYS